MKVLKNEFGVGMISMTPKTKVICPITQAPVTMEVNVEMRPDETIPEYLSVQRWFREKIDNQRLTIEQTVGMVLDLFVTNYEPKAIKVNIKAESTLYFPVEVTKEWKAKGSTVKLGGSDVELSTELAGKKGGKKDKSESNPDANANANSEGGDENKENRNLDPGTGE